MGLFIFLVLMMSIHHGLFLLNTGTNYLENFELENTLIESTEFWRPIVSFLLNIPLFLILLVFVFNFEKDGHKTAFHVLLIIVFWNTNDFIWKGIQFSKLYSDLENGDSVSNSQGYLFVYDFILPFLWIVVPATLSAFLKKRRLFYYFLLLFIVSLLAFLTGSYLSEDWARSIALYLLELI